MIRVEASVADGSLHLWVWGPGGPSIANSVHQTYYWSSDNPRETYNTIRREMCQRWELIRCALAVAEALGVELGLATDGSSLLKDFDADRELVAS